MKEGNQKKLPFEDNFAFLGDKKEMDDTSEQQIKPESTPVTQEDFDKSAGTKKEVFEFLQTLNLYYQKINKLLI